MCTHACSIYIAIIALHAGYNSTVTLQLNMCGSHMCNHSHFNKICESDVKQLNLKAHGSYKSKVYYALHVKVNNYYVH